MMRTVLESHADRNAGRVGGRVTVLGYIIADRGWDYGRRWLEDMLLSCGASDVRFIGCNCTAEDIREAGSSDLNVVVHPEYCRTAAAFLSETFGTDTLVPSMGSPVGYPSIIRFLEETAEHLGGNPSD